MKTSTGLLWIIALVMGAGAGILAYFQFQADAKRAGIWALGVTLISQPILGLLQGVVQGMRTPRR